MKRSFYHYLMTLRGPNTTDSTTKFANDVSEDIQFPKQSENYDELSEYLELNAYYLENMDLFDLLWQNYEENNR